MSIPISNPDGDYTLRQMTILACGTAWSQVETRRRIILDAKRGRLPLASVVAPGDNYLNCKVTRRAAAGWMFKNRFGLPDELMDLAPSLERPAPR